MAVHNHGTEDGSGLSCPEQIIDGELRGACMSDRCGNCGHDRAIHSDRGGCRETFWVSGNVCACSEYRKQVTLELRRCDRAGCGHPKFRHDHNGICRSCWCNTFIEKPVWRDSMQSWEPAPDKKEKPPMPDDEFVPLAEDVRHASRVLEALDRQNGFPDYRGSAHTSGELWDKAEEMDRQAEDEKRKRDKLFQLASDITVAGSGSGKDYLDPYMVAGFLLDQGWDKPDTEVAT